MHFLGEPGGAGTCRRADQPFGRKALFPLGGEGHIRLVFQLFESVPEVSPDRGRGRLPEPILASPPPRAPGTSAGLSRGAGRGGAARIGSATRSAAVSPCPNWIP